MQEQKTNWKSREVASLWPKGDYFTGRLSLSNLDFSQLNPQSVLSVVMFRNKDQNEQNSRPVFNVYAVSGAKEESANLSNAKKQSPKPAEKRVADEDEDEDTDDAGSIDALFS